MQARREPILNQPAVIPIAGNYGFVASLRSLDRDVTTVGRATALLCLEANEISTLHCVLYRTVDGYRLRDCSSRCGTRINGESIKSQTLHDGDIVNLGPFSFEFHAAGRRAVPRRTGAKLSPAKIGAGKTRAARLARAEHQAAQTAWRADRRTRGGLGPQGASAQGKDPLL